MIQIKKLSVQNFMSIGNTTQGIDFDRRDLTPMLGKVRFESVDQITNISSGFYNPKLLLQIYQNL